MEAWQAWQLAFALATVISGLALIIGELHIIERAEQAAWIEQLKETIKLPR